MSSRAKIYGLGVSLILVLSFLGIQARSIQNELNTENIEESARLNRLVGLRERLTYEAYYGFMKLGEAVVEQYRDTTYKGQRRRILRTKVTSNPKLLFVGYKEEHFNSIIANNDSTVYDLYYWKDDVAGKKKKVEEYEYDYRNGRVIARKPKSKTDTLRQIGRAHV
jgi:hypothetical protein